MKKLLQRLVIALAVAALPLYAVADYTFTQGAGTTAFDFICFTTKHCPAATIVNSAGTELGTSANPFSVDAATKNNTPTDCSIALTTGGTAQNIIAASSTIRGFTIANIDTTSGSGEPIWISFTTTAAASTIGSYPLAAPTATTFAGLSSYTTPVGFGSNHAVSVIAATTGHKISCTTW